MPAPAQLGLIEGYYGNPWSWTARAENIAFLTKRGFGFFIYAPKADSFLRKRWRDDYPAPLAGRLNELAAHCKSLGVQFGVGLSPFEIYRDFNADAKGALQRKLGALDAIGIDWLAILFDDMKGDIPRLAETQAAILEWIAAHTKAQRIIFCPTYYADDPILDRIFGVRPADYLATLGRLLDPAIDVFWTGAEVCSHAIEPAHVIRIAQDLRREPFLWDNYPVNDGARMSRFLHVRAFTGRSAALAGVIAGHAVNPALQPVLSRIPIVTLADIYAQGDAYDHGRAFEQACIAIAGAELGRMIRGDLMMLQDVGLERLGKNAGRLRARYAAFDHPVAREVVAWLDGAYRFNNSLDG